MLLLFITKIRVSLMFSPRCRHALRYAFAADDYCLPHNTAALMLAAIFMLPPPCCHGYVAAIILIATARYDAAIVAMPSLRLPLLHRAIWRDVECALCYGDDAD